jgi:hypothetical protein
VESQKSSWLTTGTWVAVSVAQRFPLTSSSTRTVLVGAPAVRPRCVVWAHLWCDLLADGSLAKARRPGMRARQSTLKTTPDLTFLDDAVKAQANGCVATPALERPSGAALNCPKPPDLTNIFAVDAAKRAVYVDHNGRLALLAGRRDASEGGQWRADGVCVAYPSTRPQGNIALCRPKVGDFADRPLKLVSGDKRQAPPPTWTHLACFPTAHRPGCSLCRWQ